MVVESYTAEWPLRFIAQSRTLTAALGEKLTSIEHIGSTAIPGLPAKPIIDLAARVAVGVDAFALEPDIASAGYHLHMTGPKNHAVYVRGTESGRTEILHVFDGSDWDECNQRLFRDKLLRDELARRRYGDLKTSLALSGVSGMEYTAAKSQLIQLLLNQERAARGLPPIIAWEK